METHLPTPMNTRVYVNLPEGKLYVLPYSTIVASMRTPAPLKFFWVAATTQNRPRFLISLGGGFSHPQ